jgi:hypothetical protein
MIQIKMVSMMENDRLGRMISTEKAWGLSTNANWALLEVVRCWPKKSKSVVQERGELNLFL